MIVLASLAMLAAVVADLASIDKCFNDPASMQLPIYKEKKCKANVLTCSNGAPVELRDTLTLNANLMSSQYFLDISTKMVRSNIPERMVHAKGAGAFGYFIVTNNTFSKYCKADLFSAVGKKTELVVRFSSSSADKGESDTSIDTRGCGFKFYTDEGNWDLLMFHTPLFMYREPFLFEAIGRIIRRNQVTNLKDLNMFWDCIDLRPEMLPLFLYLFGDNGIPDGYRHMPGHSIHTYQVYNCDGESTFCRFDMKPKCGIKNLFLEEASEIGCLDPDYAVRDLYNAIANRNYPEYDFGVQCLTAEQVRKCPFDVFDITKILPEKDYPVIPVGRIVLNRNPTNFFADVEQATFCPGNLVSGILGAPDNAFISRMLIYRDAQMYRVGVNCDNIPVNCPRNKVCSYNRDGRAPVPCTDTDGPNYNYNSYCGPKPYVDKKRPSLITIKQRDGQHDFGQIIDIYNNLSDPERSRMAGNLCVYLARVEKGLQCRIVSKIGSVSADLSYRLNICLAAAAKTCHSCQLVGQIQRAQKPLSYFVSLRSSYGHLPAPSSEQLYGTILLHCHQSYTGIQNFSSIRLWEVLQN